MSKRRSYPIRIPRFATGIRAQETQAGTWWAKAWREALERMNAGTRLGRGRNYAVSGQVTDLRLAGPHVTAKVVGTRSEPYQVTLDFRQPDAKARARLVAALRREPMRVARLLADDLPREVTEIFREEGYSLFPGGKLGPGQYDMTCSCTCPDYANPCKHTLAVLMLLGEEIERRPATLLELRGILTEELCDED